MKFQYKFPEDLLCLRRELVRMGSHAKYILSLAFILVHVLSSAQDERIIFHSFGAAGHYGFIIPHAEEIEPLSHTNPAGIELNLSRMNTSYESWKIFGTFHTSGIRASYFNFGNPGITGNAFMLTAYTEPLIYHNRRLLFSVGGGLGLSWHTRIYDTIRNPANKFFATRFSFPLYVKAGLSWKILPSALVTLSGNYNHISNGGIRQPNFGMNFPTFSAGLQYFPSQIPELKRYYERNRKPKPGISVVAQVLSGYRVVDETDVYPEKGTFAFGIHSRVSKQLTGSYALNAGGEIILDGAIREIIRREGKKTDYKRIALTAGHELLFGKAAFTQYFGFYVYSPYKAFRNIYQKYELSYRIGDMFSAGAFLKAHLYEAELLGLQVNIILE